MNDHGNYFLGVSGGEMGYSFASKLILSKGRCS